MKIKIQLPIALAGKRGMNALDILCAIHVRDSNFQQQGREREKCEGKKVFITFIFFSSSFLSHALS